MKGTYSGFRRLTCMIAALAIVCALAVVPSLSPRGAYAAAEDYAMMTAFVGADETQMNFNWYSFRRTTEQEQLLQIAEGEAGGVFPGEHDEIAVAGALSEGKVNYYVFKASVSGLKADTQYVWRVGTAGAWSETCSFRTLPSGEGLRFVALGDAQIGTNGDEVSDGAAWQDTLDAAAAVSPAFVLHMGDEVESFGSGAATLPQSEREYEQFFGARALRGVPFAGVIGNHEVSKSNWSEHHNFPNLSGNGASSSAGAQSGDYWFVAGNVQFFVLNSNVKDDGVHAAFLAEAAEAGREAYGDRIVWRVAAMHHSLFRGSTLYEQYGEEDIAQRRQSLSAAFTAQDIDLVLTGHEHIYTRAHMMRGTQPVPAEDERRGIAACSPTGRSCTSRWERLRGTRCSEYAPRRKMRLTSPPCTTGRLRSSPRSRCAAACSSSPRAAPRGRRSTNLPFIRKILPPCIRRSRGRRILPSASARLSTLSRACPPPTR